jgi:Tfp pilus assembly protein PilP
LLKETRKQIEAPIKNSMTMSCLFTYRTLTDAELAKYVAFYETEAGRWFYRVSGEGLLNAMAAGSEKLGKELVGLGNELRKLIVGRTQEKPRYSAAGTRNPFQPAALKKTELRPRESLSPLERYEIGQLKLVAIVWSLKDPVAMVEDGAGLGYIVKVGTLIGANEGKVRAIKHTEIIIDEVHVDFYGERRKRQISMNLPSE